MEVALAAAPAAPRPEAVATHELALRRGLSSVAFVRLPARACVAVVGTGPPGGEEFQDAIRTLYSAAYDLHFRLRRRGVAHRVPPLEGRYLRLSAGA